MLECSSVQRRIWFMEQLHPGTSAYNLQLTLCIDGALDVPALRRCLAEIVHRHAVLRARFRAVDGVPHPVAGELTLSLPLTDLSGQPDADAQAMRLAGRQAAEPFDLERGPLIRAGIVRMASDRHLLCWTAHHMVFDDWSYWLMMRELAALYPALRAGQPSPLPPLPVQYWDYASWQRRRLEADTAERDLTYWRRVLADPPPTSTLPPDAPRPVRPVFRGSRRSCALPPSLAPAIDAFARVERVTPFMVLLAGLQAVLHHSSGQDDIVIGVSATGRDRVEFEDLIGPFVNTLPVRVTLAPAMTFRELLHRVRIASIEAFQHQEMPFDRLVEELCPPRQPSVHPLYQVMLSVQDAPFTAGELPGLSLTMVPPDLPGVDRDLCTALLDLTLCLSHGPGQLTGDLEYNAALYHPGTAGRLLDRFTVLLEQAITDPGLSLAELIPVGGGPPRSQSADGPPEAIDLALRALAARSGRRPADHG